MWVFHQSQSSNLNFNVERSRKIYKVIMEKKSLGEWELGQRTRSCSDSSLGGGLSTRNGQSVKDGHFMKRTGTFGVGSLTYLIQPFPSLLYLGTCVCVLSHNQRQFVFPFWIHPFLCVYGICSNTCPVSVSIIRLFLSTGCSSCDFIHAYDVLKTSTNNFGGKLLQ